MVLKCIAAGISLICAVLCFLRNMHIFQLNSYKSATQIPWLFKNFGRLIPSVFFLVTGALSFFVGDVWSFVLLLLSAAVMALSHLPRKAKKPLKFTMRVIRMTVTSAVIYIAAVVLTFIFAPRFVYGVVSFAAALVPFIIMLSNIINSPIEFAVRQWYIGDAKKLLRAADKMTVIGVTGSYGKTSVKFFLGTLLKAKYDTLVTPENYNTPMGVVITVRSSLRAIHEMFVCEMGAKYKGDIKELCRLAHPRFGVITSIGEQHLETFGSLEAIVRTKFEIYRELPEDGILFVNGDNKVITDNLSRMEGKCRVVRYGTAEGCDYRAEDISVSGKGTAFTLTVPGGESMRFSTRLLGSHNVVNIAGAIAVAYNMGISLEELVPYVKKIAPVEHRLQLIENGDLTIIDDAYNSNPAGCRAALETLSFFEDTKILVTPGMVELGALEEELNRQFGRDAAAVCDYVVLVGEKQAPPIKEGLLECGFDEDKIFVVSGIKEGLSKVYSIQTDKKKIVLLENDLPDNY
ncbi:MAG: UDP-N-acetylmuramoyl-tripeptide--D-alanyl-D-alanine ligase [Clostridia bacterium]|nr:UDP-N-acetylmuramoyl-tripeptide--D-alanyl-D-alanine ligase [Clostridia bacterium]